MDLWRALVAWFTRVFGRDRLSPNDVAAPGTRGYLGFAEGDDVSDPRADSWIANLRAELPFPRPLYGTADAPANAEELPERLRDLTDEARRIPGINRALE